MPLFKRTLSEFLFRRFVLKHYGSNLLVDLQLDAKKETLRYIKDRMADAPYFEKHPQLVKYVVGEASLPGLYLEFGVGRGKSIRWIGSHTDRTVHGFDSFEGIPEYWNGNPVGAFAQSKLPKVPGNVKFHIGMFDESIPEFLSAHSDPGVIAAHRLRSLFFDRNDSECVGPAAPTRRYRVVRRILQFSALAGA